MKIDCYALTAQQEHNYKLLNKMKTDEFYKAVLSIFQEQGIIHAREFLQRRGYTPQDAIKYLNELMEQEGVKATYIGDVSSSGSEVKVGVVSASATLQSVPEVYKKYNNIPEPKTKGFFSRLLDW